MRKRKFLFFVMAFLMISFYSLHGQEVTRKSKRAYDRADYDCIIIGAGIAGLTAAYQLKDLDIKVLEKESRVGGRIFNGFYKSFSYAKGAEYIGPPEGILRRMINQLGLEKKEIPCPMDVAYSYDKFYWGWDGINWMYIEKGYKNQLIDFAEKVTDLYEEYDEIPEYEEDSDLSYLDKKSSKQWFEENGYEGIFLDKYNVSCRGLFGADMNEISALSFIPEIAYDYYDTDEDDFDLDEEDNVPEQDWDRSWAFSFNNGLAELTDKISEVLDTSVQLNSTVTKITLVDDIYTVTYLDGNSEEKQYTAWSVISAVPAPVTLKISSEVLDYERIEILEKVPYAPYITVALMSEEPIFTHGFDLAVPDNHFFTDIYDATWIQRKYDSNLSAIDDEYIICLYIAPDSYQDSSLIELSDEEILTRIYQEWRELFQDADQNYIARDIEEMIVNYDIHRMRYAYPVMTEGAYSRLTRLQELNYGSFLLAGDYTIYPTLESAVESGKIAADNMFEYLETFITEETVLRTEPIILGSVFPNPFKNSVTIEFELSQHGNTSLDIYNISGDKIRTLMNQFLSEGKHQFVWDSKDFSGRIQGTGVYLFRIKQNDYVRNGKIMFVK